MYCVATMSHSIPTPWFIKNLTIILMNDNIRSDPTGINKKNANFEDLKIMNNEEKEVSSVDRSRNKRRKRP